MTAGSDGSRAAAALFERMDPQARTRLHAREREGLPYLEADLPGAFRTIFTTRVGGRSSGPYASLNLDPRSDDEVSAIRANRSRLGRLTSDPALELVSPMQVHGLRVVGTAEYVAASAREAAQDRPKAPCDGLTLHPELDRGLAALLLFADCVPVVLAGEVDLAVVHGGWRGILGGIVTEGARAMTGPPGLAVIGPSIGPCCFTVAEQVAEAFTGRFGAHVVVESALDRPGGRSHAVDFGPADWAAAGSGPRVDLWAAVETALAEVGVGSSQVINPRLCTVCNRDLFFSYRADGPITGRQGCLAWTAAA